MKVLVLVLLLGLVYSLGEYELDDDVCPFNCSGAGICDESIGKCHCNEGYGGVGCQNKFQISSFPGIWEVKLPGSGWTYLGISTVGLTYNEVHFSITKVGGNVSIESFDLFVKRQDHGNLSSTESLIWPSFGRYDFLYSGKPDLYLESLGPAQWVLGGYNTGGLEMELSIDVSVAMICPNNCSGHGNCIPETARCLCEDRYQYASDCSVYIQPIFTNNVTNVGLLPYEWQYFQMEGNGSAANVVYLRVSYLGAQNGTDVGVYLSKGVLPSLFKYWRAATPCKDLTLMCKEIEIYNAHEIDFVVGLYVDVGVVVEIVVHEKESCPNDCSGRGDCVKGKCECMPGFQPPDCSQLIIGLSNCTTQQRSINPNEFQLYSIHVITANEMVFRVETQGVEKGLVVYLQPLSPPTPLSYFRVSEFGVQSQQIIVTKPDLTEGKWYFGLLNQLDRPIDYSVTGWTSVACPNLCSNNGVCRNGVCVCKAGHSGADCSSSNLQLPIGVGFSGAVTSSSWDYYSTVVYGQVPLSFILEETSDHNRVWIFAKRNGIPTLADHTYSNTTTKSRVHKIYINGSASGVTWTVGVYGSPTISSTQIRARYSIVAQVGCHNYDDCGSCIMDPNCGWCLGDAMDRKKGFCTAGSEMKANNHSCVSWYFSDCDKEQSQVIPVVEGIVAGLFVGGTLSCCLVVVLGVVMGVRRVVQYRRQQAVEPPQYSYSINEVAVTEELEHASTFQFDDYHGGGGSEDS